MKKPRYAGKYNFDSIYRGDSFLQKNITVSFEGQPVIPTKVLMQLRTKDNEFIYEFETEINELTGEVTIFTVNKDITKNWPIGNHTYDIEYTLESGITRTYLYGALGVAEDVSRIENEEEETP